jgi:hypothetical protein
MRKIEEQTNMTLSFKKRTTEANWIDFTNTYDGCYSYVGRVGRGSQLLSLDRPRNGVTCITQSTIIHELLHAAGFVHEQSRPDRDQYIRINYENIARGKESNFLKYKYSSVNFFNIPYDYYSIMHYRNDAFSVNGQPTIVPLNSTIDSNLMGKRNDLSPSDIQMIKIFYNGSNRNRFQNNILLFAIVFPILIINFPNKI